MRYYKASKAVTKKIVELSKKRVAFLRRVGAFMRKHGADRAKPATSYGSFSGGVRVLAGVSFPSPPDKTVWCKVRNVPGLYAPRRGVKVAAAIRTEMESIQCTYAHDVMELVSPGSDDFGEILMNGVEFHCQVCDGTAYLVAPDKWKMVGCREISWKTHNAAVSRKSRKTQAAAK